MTFIKGDGFELRVLEESEAEATVWTRHVMRSNKHMEFVMTGNAPMRWFDIRDEWKREREKGAVLFGVWSLGDLKTAQHVSDLLNHELRTEGIAVIPHPRFIGTCGLYSPYEIYRSYDSRFMIVDPEAVGKGLGVKVAIALNEYAFMKLNAHRIGLGVSALNIRAIKTYLDAGYKFEGTFKDAIYTNGSYADTYRMGITREDWEKWRSTAQ